MMAPDPAQAVYDRLWNEAQAAFAAGQVKTDPYLSDRDSDPRRGMTLIIRPAPEMIAQIGAVIDQLREIAPGQHFYHPDELHLTLLALINAAPGFDLETVPLETYRAALDDLFSWVRPFPLHFKGVSASRDTVLVCGYSPDGALNALRARLRESVARVGLGGALDQRYRIVTAHTTIMRFRTPPQNPLRLVEFLQSVHARDLGMFTVRRVDWVTNDWYLSSDRVRLLASYTLQE
ncbi:MAG: 2'-5' RNA ligase family protein [Chloroflexi bacterium]|nr:2'-5' RNA ligase family protein [Chloroflexota bacterium]